MNTTSKIFKVHFLLTCVAVVSFSSGRSGEQMLPGRTSFQPAVGKETTATHAFLLLTIPDIKYIEYFHSVFVVIDNMSAKRLGEFMFSARH